MENTDLMTAAGIKMVEIAKKNGKWEETAEAEGGCERVTGAE